MKSHDWTPEKTLDGSDNYLLYILICYLEQVEDVL